MGMIWGVDDEAMYKHIEYLKNLITEISTLNADDNGIIALILKSLQGAKRSGIRGIKHQINQKRNSMTHTELIEKVRPIIAEMDKEEYNYLIIAGKDGIGMRYMNGQSDDVHGMLLNMAQKNEQLKFILEDIVNRLNTEK